MRSLVVAGVLVLAASLSRPGGTTAQHATAQDAPDQGGTTATTGRFRFVGAASCASAACHGDSARIGTLGREYHVALERDFAAVPAHHLDKHARAYEALFEKRSKRIVKNLHGLKTLAEARPEREALCLRCHVHPEFDTASSLMAEGVRQFRLEDGVSCEACHGAAEGWLAAHFRPGFDDAARQQLGMRDTRSVAGRARICVDCHVGGPHAEVNHDLIAAGHPWLRFEFGDHHTRWHKHWDQAADQRTPDFEARAWAIGQASTAEAALRLLALRARDERRPWPEFAEQDCFACHHDLESPSWRQARGRRGVPEANRWHTAMLPAAVTALDAKDGADMRAALDELQGVLRSWYPKRDAVAGKAEAAAEQLRRWLQRARFDSEPGRFDDAATAALGAIPNVGWTDLMQQHHALAALERNRRAAGLPPAPWRPRLDELNRLLRLPPGFDSPRGFQPAPTRREGQP
jgi:hypothetical protein